MKKLCTLFLCILLISCTPQVLEFLPRTGEAKLQSDALLTSDGKKLALSKWEAEDPKAVIIGLHGYNDYSRTYELFGEHMKHKGVHVLCFDFRGFGRNPSPGIWAGEENLVEDTKDMIDAVAAEYKDLPIYLIGSSMGGAIAIETLHQYEDLKIDGLILNAPAVWGGETFNPIPKAILWMFAHTIPDKTFTGEDLDVLPTDNIDVLRQMATDEYVIKASRVDSVYGLTRLMDHAYNHKEIVLNYPTLLLYGEKDEVVPAIPILHLAHLLPENQTHIYANGYHMLLRDRQRQNVYDDIYHWMFPHESS